MSLLERFLGGSRSKAYSDGMALLADGRYAEAIDLLRVASKGRSEATSGSLASFHFRQALVAEGRRLIRAGQFNDAGRPLGEATGLWDLYPDLHFLHGTALGFGNNWDDALASAKIALRLNPDYVEARLLAALSLIHLDRKVEAADHLNALLESGRRVGHWLVSSFEEHEQFPPPSLPDNLDQLLLQAADGRTEKEEVAEAVAFCRAGNWQAGLEKFSSLVAKRPRYPDYRTRLAAALFQVRRQDEALAEVEAALALNEQYATAIDLKGLILADKGQLLEARTFLAKADEASDKKKKGVNAHEELFGAYLRAVLAMLTGDPELVSSILDGWPDLGRTFARAELLLAAADELQARPAASGRRLADLAAEWSAENLYFFLLAAHHLENRQYQDASGVLSSWPSSDEQDLRPLFLECSLALCQGRTPELPELPDRDSLSSGADTESDPGSSDADFIHPVAWDFLAAQSAYLDGRDLECWQICQKLLDQGYASEKIAHLQLAAAGNMLEVPEGPWREGKVLPQSCLAQAAFLLLRQSEPAQVQDLLDAQTCAHPEILTRYWMSPRFWLDPIRNWIA